MIVVPYDAQSPICKMKCQQNLVNHILSDAEAISQLDWILDEVLNFGLQGMFKKLKTQ